jgi:hypothetical protein
MLTYCFVKTVALLYTINVTFFLPNQGPSPDVQITVHETPPDSVMVIWKASTIAGYFDLEVTNFTNGETILYEGLHKGTFPKIDIPIIRLRPFLENIFLEKFLEKNNFLEKFSRNSRKKNQKN